MTWAKSDETISGNFCLVYLCPNYFYLRMGSQTVVAFVLETIYDRQSGDTKIRKRRYDEEYATFKRDPERNGVG